MQSDEIICAFLRKLDGVESGHWSSYGGTAGGQVVCGRVWDGSKWTYPDGSIHNNPPDYLNSIDAAHRLVMKLDPDQVIKVVAQLQTMGVQYSFMAYARQISTAIYNVCSDQKNSKT